MILSWNVRGHREIGSHLRKINCACVMLLETRVKIGNIDMVHRGMRLSGETDFVNNYENNKGRICWDKRRVKFEK